MDGDEVHEDNAVTEVLRGCRNVFHSFEMQWEKFWSFKWNDLIFPESIWLLGGAQISGVWLRVQSGRGFNQITQLEGGFHSP